MNYGDLSYCGGCLKISGSEIFLAAGGGHGDSSSNAVYSLRLADNAPAWVQRIAPSASVQQDVSHYADGKPSSRHTYQHPQFIDSLNRVLLFGAAAVYGNGSTSFKKVDAFDVATDSWLAADTYTARPDGASFIFGEPCAKDGSGNVWLLVWDTGDLYKWTAGTPGSWSNVNGAVSGVSGIYERYCAIDTTRNRLVYFGTNPARFDLGSAGAPQTSITFSGAQAAKGNSGAWVYVPDDDAFYGKEHETGTAIYRCDASTFAITTLSVTGTPDAPSADGNGRVVGRFGIAPEIKIVYYVPNQDKNVWVFRYA